MTEDILLRQLKDFETKLATAITDQHGLRVDSHGLRTERNVGLRKRIKELSTRRVSAMQQHVAQALELQKARENHSQPETEEFLERLEVTERQQHTRSEEDKRRRGSW